MAKRVGWFRESARHALAARGIETKPRRLPRVRYPVKSKTAGAVTIEGRVVQVSWPKKYQYGPSTIERFFILVVDAEGKEHKAMVTVTDERERPFVGDIVRYTTKPEKDGWGSVTEKQDFEIVSHEGKERWMAEKRAQREREREEWLRQREETRRLIEARKRAEEERNRAFRQRYGLPDLKTLTPHLVYNLLEDLSTGEKIHGRGGYHDIEHLGLGRPGTGFRRPRGPLHEMPRMLRKAVLRSLVNAGLINERLSEEGDESKDVYSITEKGMKALESMRAEIQVEGTTGVGSP